MSRAGAAVPGPITGEADPGDARSSAADPSDAAVIERSRREPECFAELFDRHAPRIHRYIARRTDRQAADDLVAETFLAAFAKRHSYDTAHQDAAPWLYGIATNLIGQHRRDEVRQARIRRAVLPEPDPPGHADRVAADVTASSVHGLLAAALAALPPGDRDVVLLVAWEQLTYTETARALGIPAGTVRSRLNRARSRLRPALAQAGCAETFEEILHHD